MVEEREILPEAPVCWGLKLRRSKSRKICLGYSSKVQTTAEMADNAIDVAEPKTQTTLLQVPPAQPSSDDVYGARKRKRQCRP